MKIPFIFLWFLVLSGGCSASAEETIVNSEQSKASQELDNLCASHTFEAVKSLVNKTEIKQEQINVLQEKIKHLELTIVEDKFKDDLILSKDNHIKDLRTVISHGLSQHAESVNNEIVQLKLFIKDELSKELSKIDSNAEKLRYCDDKLLTAELSLTTCQLSMNELDLQNNTEYAASVSELKTQLKSDNEILKECQTTLSENQESLKNQTEVIEQTEQQVSELKGQVNQYEETPTGCINFPTSNEKQRVKIAGFEAFEALCDSLIVGPGWTVIQQRKNGKENFTRGWNEYMDGFGSLSGDFFLGLEKIHRLTNVQPHVLYIHMERFNGNTFYARYDNFKIAGDEDNYRLLSLGNYSGNAGKDKMRHSEHHMFSTIDYDNDDHEDYDCAFEYEGGWWFSADPCTHCNLNGRYYSHEVDKIESNYWHDYYSLKTTKMLIHPVY